MIIGERLKEARLNKNMTQESLGNLLGVTKVSICGYENGTKTPTMRNFLNLIKFLDLDVKYLLGQDLNVVCEDNELYTFKMAKIDIEILNQIKENRKLYNLFCSNPKQTVEKITNDLKI